VIRRCIDRLQIHGLVPLFFQACMRHRRSPRANAQSPQRRLRRAEGGR
jgi:hypothetical protein